MSSGDRDGLSELEEAIIGFVEMFETVFCSDWEMTEACIRDSQYLIADEGTFLTPNVDDESNNWGNRGRLLASYRQLVMAMGDAGLPKSIIDNDDSGGVEP